MLPRGAAFARVCRFSGRPQRGVHRHGGLRSQRLSAPVSHPPSSPTSKRPGSSRLARGRPHY